jgi:beta-1,4-N-acetylglucosaminyltransferase
MSRDLPTQLTSCNEDDVICQEFGDMSVFVSVGTTRFDELINTVLGEDVLNALKAKGHSKVVVQTGNSDFQWEGPQTSPIPVELFKFKSSLEEDISGASLVISHAGAGTCLEVQKAQKPHIVVVNEDLMNNHQIELAEKLADNGHCEHCVPRTLCETITKFEPSSLTPLPPGNPQAFADFLDNFIFGENSRDKDE